MVNCAERSQWSSFRVKYSEFQVIAVSSFPLPADTYVFEIPGAAASGDEEEDTLFLSGALVHLACCTPAEQLEMVRILREGGCTRRPDLRNDVTHVLVRQIPLLK